MKMKFKHPQHDFVEEYNTSTAWLWCLLFGWIYWAVRGNVRHAIIWAALILPTLFISAFVYPFYANKINLKHYARNGWKAI